jgi:hypothetical protein
MGDVEKAERAGEKYAEDQVESDYFQEWVREHMYEGEKLRPEEVAPGLETETVARDKRAAERLAKNMLQQLRWDIEQGIDTSEIDEALLDAGIEAPRSKMQRVGPAFWEGLRSKLESTLVRDWLAQDVIMPIAKELTRGRRRRK